MNITAQEINNQSKSLCFLFSGKAGVGKSYCSGVLNSFAAEFGIKSVNFPFAKGVKDTARFMGWDGNKDAKGRKLLQIIGNSGRAYDKNIWIKKMLEQVDNSQGFPFTSITVDDWRYINEYNYIVENRFLYKPIRIRIYAPDRETLFGTPLYLDDSEVELDNFEFDYIVNNSKDADVEPIIKNIFFECVKNNTRR